MGKCKPILKEYEYMQLKKDNWNEVVEWIAKSVEIREIEFEYVKEDITDHSYVKTSIIKSINISAFVSSSEYKQICLKMDSCIVKKEYNKFSVYSPNEFKAKLEIVGG